MNTRQAHATHYLLRVMYRGVNIVVRFKPDQRRAAMDAFILQAFLLNWIPPLTHWAFEFITAHTWENQP